MREALRPLTDRLEHLAIALRGRVVVCQRSSNNPQAWSSKSPHPRGSGDQSVSVVPSKTVFDLSRPALSFSRSR
jgi:hypothetical protein